MSLKGLQALLYNVNRGEGRKGKLLGGNIFQKVGLVNESVWQEIYSISSKLGVFEIFFITL